MIRLVGIPTTKSSISKKFISFIYSVLQHLSISNYALISALEIDFSQGLSVITGETGAGKSIILGALGLIMGQRADSKSITEGEQKCVIEATFDITAYDFQSLFAENDLDYDAARCVIRRELTANGKSRSFVNDTPIALTALKQLTAQLIDIHSQHQNLLLGDTLFQFSVVDMLAQNGALRHDYSVAYKNHQQLQKRLKTLQERAAAQRTDQDYMQFQYQQLAEAALQPDEMEQLEEEHNLLAHAEEVKVALSSIYELLHGEQRSVVPALKEATQQMRRIESYLPVAAPLTERLESAYIEIKDIAAETEQHNEKILFDPVRQQQVAERLDLLYTLLQKHHKPSVAELLVLQGELAAQLEEINSFDGEILAAQKAFDSASEALKQRADALTGSRQSVVASIAEQMMLLLQQLGITHPQFIVNIQPVATFTEHGADEVEFLFAANKNQQPQNAAQVASGGEISRMMLCLKTLMAKAKALPTILFDEIDTGVSGEVADSMGTMMQEIAANRQVLTITHLPQIAAKSQAHLKVYKVDTEHRTETNIKPLQPDERIREIAQMLSGNNITEAAIQNAKVLLGMG